MDQNVKTSDTSLKRAIQIACLSVSLIAPFSLNAVDLTAKRQGPLVKDRTYKALPFEPLTDNRLKRQQRLAVKPHKGNSWIEFKIKQDDTLYTLIRSMGLSVKDLFVILHAGPETESLKHLRPGQIVQVHANDAQILEIHHKQSAGRETRVKREGEKFVAQVLHNGVPQTAIAVTEQIRQSLQQESPQRRPYHAAARYSAYPSLRTQTNQDLQARLERTMQRLGLQQEISRKHLAVALVDITDLSHPRLASLNGNEMMYAASLPKIAILLGAFVEIEQGNLALDAHTRDALTQMIRYSSNEYATEMLRKVGNQRLQQILMSDRFKLYDPSKNGGLWVGKEYGKNPAFGRDPLHNLSHGATVLQAARFYYLLETGQLVSPELSAQMKEMLSDPQIHHKFVKGLENRPGSKIFRKSGTWRHWHADSALVEANGFKYIVVAMAEDARGGKWLADMITPLHDLIVPTTYAQYAPEQ